MKAKTNIKAMTKPELTDQEIQSHMDFNKLLKTYQESRPTNTFPKWTVYSGIGIVVIAIVSTAVYFYTKSDTASLDKNSPAQPVTAIDTTAKSVSKATQVPARKKKDSIEHRVTKKTTIVSKQLQLKDSVKKEKSPAQQFVEASPVDGYPSLYSYFDKELKYPAAPKDSIQGIVTVSFAITKTGKPDFIKIENSLGPSFDDECIRVIQHMPPWKPATMNGKPVQTRLSIPLSFKIKK